MDGQLIKQILMSHEQIAKNELAQILDLDETQLGLCFVLLLNHVQITILPIRFTQLDWSTSNVFAYKEKYTINCQVFVNGMNSRIK